MKNWIFILLFLITACSAPKKPELPMVQEEAPSVDRELFYHYSIWTALVNEIFDGTLTAGELKTKGDIALGTYNALNGELVMVDGVLYQVLEDGTVRETPDDEQIPYTNATYFDPDITFELEGPADYEILREAIEGHIPSENYFYGIRITGEFNYMKCGGVPRQEKPYTEGLDVLMPIRPVFERENVKGTIVGFLCPEFIGNINVAGFHLHFVSDDRQFGGHVMEFDAASLTVGLDKTSRYQFVLPDTEDFSTADFEKEFQYGR